MFSKRSFTLAAAGAAIAMGGAMVSTAQAYSYTELVRNVFEAHGGNAQTPLIYRDQGSNYSLTFTQNGTEYVLGAVLYDSIHAGNTQIPAIKDIAASPANRERLGLNESAPAVGGLFLAQAAGVQEAGAVGPEGGTLPHQYFAPAESGSYSFTDRQGNEVSFDWNPMDPNALLQLFADDTGAFANNMQFGAQQAIDNMSTNMLAEIGFFGDAMVGAQYALGQEYYAVELEFDGTDFVGPREFVANLNVLNDWGGLFPGVKDHDGQNQIHMFGRLLDDASGGWDFTGDGARISFIVPSPVAVGPGLVLLGVISMLRKPRRNEAAAA
ncbi:hypothetical protein ACERK3_04370 [Phycisphaerales bacterium AB-hyl4]|uniref:Secreted protein n=1 Tax=Natronomicrosphaera hydrolytica TaxID=3242702 RepID=A0ABV4U1P2_9BACT